MGLRHNRTQQRSKGGMNGKGEIGFNYLKFLLEY